MRIRVKSFVAFLTFFIAAPLLGVPAAPAQPYSDYIIDAHSQLDAGIAPSRIVSLMDEVGVKTTLLSLSAQARSLLPIEVVNAADQFPGRFIPAIDSKAVNETVSMRRVEAEIESGKYQAVGEVLIFHEAKPAAHAERFTYAFDTPFIAKTLDYAFANHWPAIAHIEFTAMTATEKPFYQNMLETELNAQPDNAFALNNLGQLTPDLAGTLLAGHKNLYLLTSTTSPAAIGRTKYGWTNMFQGSDLSPAWKQLVERYPDRFLLAFDNVTAERWERTYVPDVRMWRQALGDLPPDVARAMAHGNAERLWHLTP